MMGDGTKIEWTDATWNPVTGCTKISPGCDHCYAERMARRLAGRAGYPKDEPFRVTYHHDKFGEPYDWMEPRMIFVCSMGDLFHQDVPDHYINQVIQAVQDNTRHTFQVLTKRAHRMAGYFKAPCWPPSNLWAMVTAENQAMVDLRAPQLCTIASRVRGVSVEPMLGPVSLKRWFSGGGQRLPINWVICGGETGPGARPMHPAWVRELRDECAASGVPFLFKRWGEWTAEFPQGVSLANRQMTYEYGTTFYRMGARLAGRVLDGQTWDQFPER